MNQEVKCNPRQPSLCHRLGNIETELIVLDGAFLNHFKIFLVFENEFLVFIIFKGDV